MKPLFAKQITDVSFGLPENKYPIEQLLTVQPAYARVFRREVFDENALIQVYNLLEAIRQDAEQANLLLLHRWSVRALQNMRMVLYRLGMDRDRPPHDPRALLQQVIMNLSEGLDTIAEANRMSHGVRLVTECPDTSTRPDGRSRFGQGKRNPRVLTKEKADQIRMAWAQREFADPPIKSYRDLGRKFGLQAGRISMVVRGKAWV